MKYRNPIMSRVPFIMRRPIFNRVPIVTRTSVYDRNPVTTTIISHDGCMLYDRYIGCNGCLYCKPEDTDVDTTVFRLIYITKDMNLDKVVEQLQIIEDSKKFVRVITEVLLPEEVILAIAYSPFNVVQFNVQCLEDTETTAWRKCIYFADKCGLYISMFLYPIIPTVVKLVHVISWIERYSGVCDFVALKFLDTAQMPEFADGYYNINGRAIPSNYIEPNEVGGVRCSEEFMYKFLSTLNTFIKPRKINVTICNEGNCY